MQSTGHTSTQERSFTPMQGSAMMYGMRGRRASPRPAARPNRKHTLGPPPVKCAPRSGFVPAAQEILVLLNVFCHIATAHRYLVATTRVGPLRAVARLVGWDSDQYL